MLYNSELNLHATKFSSVEVRPNSSSSSITVIELMWHEGADVGLHLAIDSIESVAALRDALDAHIARRMLAGAQEGAAA